MDKDQVTEVKKLLSQFDPELLAVAVKGDETKSELIAEEVENIRKALAEFDGRAVEVAVSDYFDMGRVPIDCGGPVCTCPEGDGCRAKIRCGPGGLRSHIDRYLRESGVLGLSGMTAMRDLERHTGASAVIGVGDHLGYSALCFDSVRCVGKSIFVMSRCMASLYSHDIGAGVIDPIDAIVAIAQTSPVLARRVQAMVAEMEKAGELPAAG